MTDLPPSSQGPAAGSALSESGPLFSVAFTLTRADALAWETLPRELSARQKLVMFALLALAGAGYAAVEDHRPVWFLLLPSPVQFALIAALAYGLWKLGLRLNARRRARRRLPAPLPCQFQDWGDHFAWKAGPLWSHVATETVLAVTATPSHVFVATPSGPLILPVSAFPDAETARACASVWQARLTDDLAVDLPAQRG